MNAREFLVLAEQLAAFQTVMAGSLKAETQAAQEAIAALGDAKTIKARADSIASEQAALEAYRASQKAELDSYREDLLAKSKAQDEIQAGFAAREAAVKDAEDKAIVLANNIQIASEQLDKKSAALDAQLAKVQAAIDAKKAEYQSVVDDVTAREAALQAKVDALKALAA